MKKYIVAILTALSFLLLFADISSTADGGNWNAPGTWIGAVVPTANDNVIINGTVLVNTTASCLDLTINSTGILQNSSSSSYHLHVYGNLNNVGIISSPTPPVDSLTCTVEETLSARVHLPHTHLI